MADAHQTQFDGLSSLLSFAGIAIPARARFVAQFVSSTLFTSVTFGLAAGQTVGAMVPALGPPACYVLGSWIGYTWGCAGFWRTWRERALSCARCYPKVLAHGLFTNFDVEVPRNVRMDVDGKDGEGNDCRRDDKDEGGPPTMMSLEEWIVAGGVGRLSFAMMAAQCCEEDITEMRRNERQRLVDEYSQRGSDDK
jgi:hypothetical protein